MTRILILYEDSRAAKGPFGPHEFLLGCVADESGRSVYEVRALAKASPVRGAGNLLKALKHIDDLNRSVAGAHVLAIADSDRIRKHFSAAGPETTNLEIAERIRADSSAPDRLTVVLLERNLETVIEAIRGCDAEGSLDHALIQDALDKDLNARDRLLARVGRDPGRQQVRACVRQRVPSLEPAIRCVVSALEAGETR